MNEKDEEILKLLYRFRFLSAKQIQFLLNHKHPNRVYIWLNKLHQEKYIKQTHNNNLKTTPSYFSLGKNARKHLKKNPDTKYANPLLLNRIWREDKLSCDFKKRCLFVADIYLSLILLTRKTKASLSFFTKTDLYKNTHTIYPLPDSFFTIKEKDGAVNHYFLDILDLGAFEKVSRKRSSQYIRYHAKSVRTKNAFKPFPKIIFICPDNRCINFISKRIKYKLGRKRNPRFLFAIGQEVREEGLNKKTLRKI